MTAEHLTEDLLFTENGKSASATVTTPDRFVRNDIVQFATGQQCLVMGKAGSNIIFGRMGERRYRRLGGAAYRRWDYRENRVDVWGEPCGDYIPAPRHRAKPLYRSRKVWPAILIPANTLVLPLSHAYAEGAEYYFTP